MNSGKTSRLYSSARRRGVAMTEVVLKKIQIQSVSKMGFLYVFFFKLASLIFSLFLFLHLLLSVGTPLGGTCFVRWLPGGWRYHQRYQWSGEPSGGDDLCGGMF